MIRINENGDVVLVEPHTLKELPYLTAAELKAAFAERGMVVISVEDARRSILAIQNDDDAARKYGDIEASNVFKATIERLFAAIKD